MTRVVAGVGLVATALWIPLYLWLSDARMWANTVTAVVVAFGSTLILIALLRAALGSGSWIRPSAVLAVLATLGLTGYFVVLLVTARPAAIHVESCRQTQNSASNWVTSCSGTWPGGAGRFNGARKADAGHDVEGWAASWAATTDRGEWLPVPFGLLTGLCCAAVLLRSRR